MGNRTAPAISSKSVYCRPQFGCLISVFLLILVIDACICRSSASESHRRSSRDNHFVYEAKKDRRKTQQKPAGKCLLSAAGSKQLERGVQLPLAHVYGSCSPVGGVNLSWESVLPRILEQDRLRAQVILPRMLGNISDSAEAQNIPVSSGSKLIFAAFVTNLGFGTPKEDYAVAIDTGSDITWILCKPCPGCSSEGGAVFEPQRSSSFKPLRCLSDDCQELRNATILERSCLVGDYCVFTALYMDNARASGQYSLEKLTVGSDIFDNFGFGCCHDANQFGKLSGLLGLGRGTVAFPFQTLERYLGRFSYCLPDFNSDALGSLSFGRSAIPSSGVFTEMMLNRTLSNNYFLLMSGISVGGQLVALPSRLFNPSEGGPVTFIDSGAAITSFANPIYDAFEALFVNQTSGIPRAEGYSVLEVCYNVPVSKQASFPDVTLHFEDGAEVNLKGPQVVIPVNDDTSHLCLAFRRQQYPVNVIGSFQQVGFRVSYDIANQRIGFAPESCTSPS